VAEVAVVGVPDERWGEVPKAWVALRPGQEATAEELVDWVRDRLARFKAPKSVTFLPELPKLGTGKIAKADLKRRG
jgi:fatty-acyl-CoA synthase